MVRDRRRQDTREITATPKTTTRRKRGTNQPCSEEILHRYYLCNLSPLVLILGDSFGSLFFWVLFRVETFGGLGGKIVASPPNPSLSHLASYKLRQIYQL